MVPTELASLTVEHFIGRVDEVFDLSIEEDSQVVTQLILESAKAIGVAGGPIRQAFSLSFLGPANPALQQETYWLTNPHLGSLPIFLVPISGNSETRRYEAIFN